MITAPVPAHRAVLAVVLAMGVPAVALVVLELAGARALGAVAMTVAVVMAASRARSAPAGALRGAIVPFAPAVALAVITSLLGDERFLLSAPALISATVLATFAGSLRPGRVPAIERFARLERALHAPGTALSPEAVRHCRRFTMAWCAFLATNTVIAAALAWLAPVEWWAGYTCILAYVLMGALFVAERVARARMVRSGIPLSGPPPTGSE